MIEHNGRRYLTVMEAAKRVERTRQTIETWIAQQLLTVRYAEGSRVRMLDEIELKRVLVRKNARSKHIVAILELQERDNHVGAS